MNLYHGTNSKFDSFRQDKARLSNDLWGGGIAYLTDNLDIAKGYATAMNRKYGGKKYIYTVEYDPKKVFDVDAHFTGEELTKFYKNKPQADIETFARGCGLMKYGTSKFEALGNLKDGSYDLTGAQIFKGLSNGMVNTSKAREVLKSLGYDSLRYNGGLINQTTSILHNVYVVFSGNIHILKVEEI